MRNQEVDAEQLERIGEGLQKSFSSSVDKRAEDTDLEVHAHIKSCLEGFAQGSCDLRFDVLDILGGQRLVSCSRIYVRCSVHCA